MSYGEMLMPNSTQWSWPIRAEHLGTGPAPSQHQHLRPWRRHALSCAVNSGGERLRTDADPSAGTRRHARCPLQPLGHHHHHHHHYDHPAALMKPPLPNPNRAEGRTEEREDVLARRVRVDPLVRAWAGPEQELLAGLLRHRRAALAVWLHHRVPAAGVRRDHVRVSVRHLVEENPLHHRGRAARRRCLFTTRAACHQVFMACLT